MMLEIGSRIRAEKEKLALSNFEDLERKKKVLQQVLISTVACMYTKHVARSMFQGWQSC